MVKYGSFSCVKARCGHLKSDRDGNIAPRGVLFLFDFGKEISAAGRDTSIPWPFSPSRKGPRYLKTTEAVAKVVGAIMSETRLFEPGKG